MNVEEVPMFDAPTREISRSEIELQWRQWRNACPLRRLLPGQEDAIAGDWSEPGGWRTTLDAMRSWIATRPAYPWQKQ